MPLSGMNDPTYEYYNARAKEFFDETVNLDMGAAYEAFLKLLPKGGKILDAGCGSGRDSLYFKKKGYDVVAFDSSGAMVKLASDFIGSHVLHMTFDDVAFTEAFDGVWACASLLHVPKSRMEAVMYKLALALKRGGVLYASFKYGDREEIRRDRHFSDYTESEFQILANKIASLSIIKHWKTADARPNRQDEYWFNVLLRKEA